MREYIENCCFILTTIMAELCRELGADHGIGTGTGLMFMGMGQDGDWASLLGQEWNSCLWEWLGAEMN